MKNKWISFWRKMVESTGVNYSQANHILHYKYMMDKRQSTFISQNMKKKDADEKEKNMFLSGHWIYIFTGFMMGLMIFVKSFPLFYTMNIIYGITIYMLITGLISVFSDELLNVKDEKIFGGRPVTQKTLNYVKTMHIGRYLLMIGASLVLPSAVFGTFAYGPTFFIVSLFGIIACSLFSLIMTQILYFFLLKYFDGEKLKDIINYAQIVMTVTVTIGYQVIIRIFDIVDTSVSYSPALWHSFFPSAWYASLYELLLKGNTSMHSIVNSVLSIVVLLILAIVYNRVLAPDFNKYLFKLENASEKSEKKRKSLSERLGKIICRQPKERAVYNFTNAMFNAERSVKRLIIPNLVLSILFPIVFMFIGGIPDFKNDDTIYRSIYWGIFMLTSVVPIIEIASTFKGAWIYKALPFEKNKYIMRGAFKALLVKYLMPTIVIVDVIFLVAYQGRLFIEIISMIFLSILIFTGMFLMGVSDYPFSHETSQRNRGFGTFLKMYAILGLVGAVHFLFIKMNWSIVLLIGIFILAEMLALKFGFDKYDKIKKTKVGEVTSNQYQENTSNLSNNSSIGDVDQ